MSAIVAKHLPVQSCVIPDSSYVEKYPYMKGIKFDEIADKKVSLILGVDEPTFWAVKESRCGFGRKDPVAILTPLGWSLVGAGAQGVRGSSFIQVQELKEISEQLEKLYQQDFGDINADKLGLSQEDVKALKVWDETCRLVEHQGKPHYELGLPWRQGKREDVILPPLSDRKNMAKKRMINLKRRFLKNPDEFNKCCEQMNKYKEEGHARIIPPEDLKPPDGCPQ